MEALYVIVLSILKNLTVNFFKTKTFFKIIHTVGVRFHCLLFVHIIYTYIRIIFRTCIGSCLQTLFQGRLRIFPFFHDRVRHYTSTGYHVIQ